MGHRSTRIHSECLGSPLARPSYLAHSSISYSVETFYRRDQTEVITADRYLRKAAQAVGAKTINPVKWWRRYLPRIKGLKSDYSNEQKPTN